MRRGVWLTIIFMLLVVGGILAALVYHASQGPVFRAEAYESWEECVRNIPEEWASGSLARTGAVTACGYAHERSAPRGP